MVFIPRAWHTGRKIGVKIKHAGVISINVPTTRRITLIIRKMTILFSLTDKSPTENAYGMFVKEITHDIMLDTPMRKIMIPVISALSFKMGIISLSLMDLYTNKDKSRLYTTATTAPSVAVKIPLMMPPITMRISKRQGKA